MYILIITFNPGIVASTQREGSEASFNCLISSSVATGKGDEAEPAPARQVREGGGRARET